MRVKYLSGPFTGYEETIENLAYAEQMIGFGYAERVVEPPPAPESALAELVQEPPIEPDPPVAPVSDPPPPVFGGFSGV